MPITGPDMLPIHKRQYLIGEKDNVDDILDNLHHDHQLHEMEGESGTHHYYDTFDWRLYRKKMVFTVSGNRAHLGRFNGKTRSSAAGEKKERLFCWDFDDPRMNGLLKKYIDMRALCPLFSLICESRNFKVLNRDRKTVAWVRLTRRKTRCGPVETELPESLCVTSVRGYEKWYAKIVKSLDGRNLQSIVSDSDLIDRACGICERQPLDYGARFYVKLDRTASVGAAVAKICLHLVDSMEKNRGGLCNDIDSEFLHDFRIAVRRTRSLLTLLKKYMPPEQLSHYETEFKWLGSVTGPVRDIDVYLLKKEAYRNLLPPSLRDGLALFFADLAARRSDEVAELKMNLRSARYQNLVESWKQFLSDPRSGLFQGVRKKRCLPLVNGIISRRFKRFIAEADLISAGSSDGQLHKLRIKGKKFRYLLEFFRSFYADREIGLFLKHMKNVQDNLGDFNDLSVQIEMLENTLQELKGRNKRSILLAAALGSLITRLKSEHQQVRAQFHSTYETFRTEKNQRLMERLTNPEPSTASLKRKK